MTTKIVKVFHVIRPESRLFKEIVETYRTQAEAEHARDSFNYTMTDGVKAVVKVEKHEVSA